MGGTSWNQTKHLGPEVPSLCDFLPSCNRFSRVLPNRLSIPNDGYAFIYDLKSFTSNLLEVRHFLWCLGEYCEDYEIPVMDSQEGVHHVNLKMLIQMLAENCNGPEYTSGFTSPINVSGTHKIAGMLGVYGNIAMATFLHAAVLLQLFDNEDHLNVVGDDGVACILPDQEEMLVFTIGLLGTLEMSKVYRSNESGCLHLKKSIIQVSNHLISISNIPFPSLEYCLHEEQIDPRYPFISEMSYDDRRTASASSYLSFISSINPQRCNDRDLEFLEKFPCWYYTNYGLPMSGHVPQISGNNTLGFVPPALPLMYDKSLEYGLRLHYSGTAILPVREVKAFEKEDLEKEQFYANSAPHLTYLEKLGYFSRETPSYVVFGIDGFDALYKEYTLRLKKLYLYKRINRIPLRFT
jgi:hypothetical protein